jgi:hypothetical protein
VQRRLDLPEEASLPERLTTMRKGDDHPVPRASECRKLVLRLRKTACGDRGPLRLELERLPARERIEVGDTLQRERR